MSESLPDLPDVYALMRLKGPFQCTLCGSTVERPMSVCTKCGDVFERDQVRAAIRSARESIPERFRWASLEDPEAIAARTSADGRWRIGKASVRAVRSLPRPVPLGVVLRGPSEAGKTTLACAVLRRVHDRAERTRDPQAVDLARRAFFVSAIELEVFLKAREFGRETEGPNLMERAMHASVLVLDNVEPGSTTSAVGRVLFSRMNRRTASSIITILTTWMSKEEFDSSYGEGVRRRAYQCEVQLEPEQVGGTNG